MENYLEALERLGKLLDSGVLTKEEFEQEKARLLGDAGKRSRMSPNRRRRLAFTAGLALAAVAGIGLAYAVITSIPGGKAEPASAEEEASAASGESLLQPVEVSVSFADASNCEPGPTFAKFLDRIREAANANHEEGRFIKVAGTQGPTKVESATQEVAQDQVRLARLPVSLKWQGLRVTGLQTSDWDGGSGFQVRFATSGESALRALQAEGFELKSVSEPLAVSGYFVAIENAPGGSVLTCMHSNQVSEETE